MDHKVLGIIAKVMCLVLVLVGLPAQILKIYNTKKVDGISGFSYFALFVAMASCCAYGLATKDLYILIASVCGVVFSFVILCQMQMYRSNKGHRYTFAFTVSEMEMQIFKINGEVCLNRIMADAPRIGRGYDLHSHHYSESGRVIKATLVDPGNNNYDITILRDN